MLLGIADVHCGGQGLDAGARLPVPRCQKFRQYPIGVGGQNDVPDRHAHRARPDAGQGIAQVTGGHDETGRFVLGAPMPQAGRRMVDHLGQQPAQIDAVGGTQAMVHVQ